MWLESWTLWHIVHILKWIHLFGLEGITLFFKMIKLALFYELFNAIHYPSITNTISAILNFGYYTIGVAVPIAFIANKVRRKRNEA
jgi:hypothetical protein